MRKKKDPYVCPPTMMLGDHRVATATGCCLTTCPACLRGDFMNRFIVVGLGILLVLGIFCGHCSQ